jgi:hypothetical protein
MSKVNARPTSPPTVRSLSPIGVLNAALRAVPALKYALGVAAIALLGAFVIGVLGDVRAAIIIIGAMFVGMLLLFVFARLTVSESSAITSAGVFLLWVTILFFCAFLILITTAVSVGWPPTIVKIVHGQEPPVSRDSVVGRWRGPTTDIEWRKDNTCSGKLVTSAGTTQDVTCHWHFEGVSPSVFHITAFAQTSDGTRFTYEDTFEIKSEDRIHSLDGNYDAFRLK